MIGTLAMIRGGERTAELQSVDTSTPILIFGLAPGERHHGALGIARSAGRLGIEVHRVALERSGPATLSRYNRSWEQIPPEASPQQVIDLLHVVGRRIGGAILVAVDDASTVFVEEHALALEGDFTFARQPNGLAQQLSSKRGMYELCHEHDVPTAHSEFPDSEHDALEYAGRTSYPAVLKCIDAGRAPDKSPRVAIVNDAQQLMDAYRSMESLLQKPNVMFQEYIPGPPETVWMFNGYFDEGSECKIGFTGKKIRQSPPYTGATTLGVCLENQFVEDTTIRFMKEIGYKGILDIGYRFDERDGQYKLLDVNPRIGATFRLFVGNRGLDVLRAMYLDLTGQEVPEAVSPLGRRWMVGHMDLSSSLVYRRRGDLTALGWLRSLRGVRETAWFSLDDPLPFIVIWAQLLSRRTPGHPRWRAHRRARRPAGD